MLPISVEMVPLMMCTLLSVPVMESGTLTLSLLWTVEILLLQRNPLHSNPLPIQDLLTQVNILTQYKSLSFGVCVVMNDGMCMTCIIMHYCSVIVWWGKRGAWYGAGGGTYSPTPHTLHYYCPDSAVCFEETHK